MDQKVSLSKLRVDQEMELDLDENIPFMNKILLDMMEEVDIEDRKQLEELPSIKFTGKMLFKFFKTILDFSCFQIEKVKFSNTRSVDKLN